MWRDSNISSPPRFCRVMVWVLASGLDARITACRIIIRKTPFKGISSAK